MAKSNASEMLTSLDSLFTTQEQRDEAKRDSVQDIPISQISDFPEHPFKVKQDEAMLEMAESVRQYGVLVPGLVRQLEDGSYQMVSGHRRKLASELAGRDTIPCIVRDLTDDEAVIIMVDSNLQRERVLPSEKAFAYKMKLDAMRRQQGERTDLTSAPVGQKFDGKTSRELLAIESPDSQKFQIVQGKSNAISASPTSSRKFWTWWMTVGSPFALRWSFLTLPNRSRARFMTPWDARTARRRLHRPLR